MARYDSIQLMRGIAAMAVVFVHIPTFGRGHFGVDLFFCISGFIMMHITEKDDDSFLLKRAIRIVPLYWAATLALCAVMHVAPHLVRTAQLRADLVIKSLLFIPFTLPGRNGSLHALLGTGWTLVYEAFFYLLHCTRPKAI